MSEKTEKATPFKLKKSREQGQVAKSTELNTVLALLIFCGVFLAVWQRTLDNLLVMFTKIFIMSGKNFNSIEQIHGLFYWVFSALIALWLPFALAVFLTIILSTIAQTGLVFTAKPLVPDFTRLNPAKGFKRLFSMRLFFDLFKNIVKPLAAFIGAGLSIYWSLPEIMQLVYLPAEKYMPVLIPLILKIIFQVLIILAAVAFVDTVYTRWKYGRDQRMSKQEVKDEYKRREGDPKIKQKIKQLQQQMMVKINAMRHVKHADVIVTNPTRLAIALKYDRGLMPAPKVLAKGQGEQAKQIRKIATKHQIPIIEHKPLAQALFKESHLNQWIKSSHFAMAAVVFRDLYQKKGLNL